MADATSPLAPLAPTVIDHLTEALGPPESFLLTIDEGGLDIRAVGWIIGFGRLKGGGTAGSQRGTDVTIRLTVAGGLVTTRCSWTEWSDGSSKRTQTGDAQPSPQAAFEWLLRDGGGKLGPASKVAWVQACRNVPPMATTPPNGHAVPR